MMSNAERGNYRLADLRSGVLLLSGDQAAITHYEGFEQAALDIVRPSTPEVVLNPKRHHLLADCFVGEVLLDVREPGYSLPFDQIGPVGKLDLDQCGDAVAQDRSRLFGLVERGDYPL